MATAVPAPEDEAHRLTTLRALGLLDTPPEERFDRITRLARRLFGVPMALISLVDEDRQWFKSRQGFDVAETPRAFSLCAHAILGEGVMQVPDTEADPRFADNPFVVGDPNIRFYAGCPFTASDGSKLGTLCVIDRTPRELDDEDARFLAELAELVEREIRATELALHDELTGLCNRRGFLLLGERVLDLCVRQGLPATVVFADLDGLKPINDRFGHEEGDSAIREAATLLRTAFRSSDLVARLAGDEFVALLTAATKGEEAVDRLAQLVERRNDLESNAYRLMFSLGTAAFDPAEPVSLAELLCRADKQMYVEKERKRRRRRS